MKAITLNTKKLTLAAVVAVGLACTAVEAQADAAADAAPSRTVHYADLDLRTQAGAAILYQRIRAAADRVCGDYDTRDIGRTLAAKACIRKAVTESVRSVNDERLTSEYNRHLDVQEKTVNLASLH